MHVIQRSISTPGPKFFIDGGVLMFVNQIDASTRIGPRPATNQDMLDFPDALAATERPEQPMYEDPGQPGFQDSEEDEGAPEEEEEAGEPGPEPSAPAALAAKSFVQKVKARSRGRVKGR